MDFGGAVGNLDLRILKSVLVSDPWAAKLANAAKLDLLPEVIDRQRLTVDFVISRELRNRSASNFGTEGWGFEPLRTHSKSTGKLVLFALDVMSEFRRLIMNSQKFSNRYRHEGGSAHTRSRASAVTDGTLSRPCCRRSQNGRGACRGLP